MANIEYFLSISLAYLGNISDIYCAYIGNMFSIQGVSKKNFTVGISILFSAINMLEEGIFHLKGGIHSSVLSTKTFLYNITELRCKQNNMENKI